MSRDVAQMAHITAQVPADLRDEFKQLATDNDRSTSAELRLAMRAHIDAQVEAPRERAAS